MQGNNPIVNAIIKYKKSGKTMVCFYPENILDDKKRKIVLRFDDGSLVELPIQGNMKTLKKQLTEADEFRKGKEYTKRRGYDEEGQVESV